MSNIIPFPSKNNFKSQFKGTMPDEILNTLLEAYDRVLSLKDGYPSGSFRVEAGYEKDAKHLTDDFQNYTLELLKRILDLEVEICLTKQKQGC